MILKAGTYRFNDVLTDFPINIYNVLVPVTFNVTAEGEIIECKGFYCNAGILFDYLMVDDKSFTCYSFEMVLWETDILQLHTITSDTEVDDTFGTWYIANTNYNEVNAKPLAEITYNGETIAQLNAGETCTIKCGPTEDTKYVMASDVVVKVNKVEKPTTEEITVTPSKETQEITPTSADYLSKVTVNAIPSKYIVPSGTLSIDTNGTHDVTNKASVNVNVLTSYMVETAENLPTDAPQGALAIVWG